MKLADLSRLAAAKILAFLGVIAVVVGSLTVPFAFLSQPAAPWLLAAVGATKIAIGVLITLIGDRVAAPVRLEARRIRLPGRLEGLPVSPRR